MSLFEKKSFNPRNTSYGPGLLILLVLLTGISVFHPYLTFKKLYLFKDIGSDTLNIVLPQYLHISDYLRTEGIPKWSFNQGMGQNIFPFSLGLLFDVIPYLLGREFLVFGIVYGEFLKVLLAAVLFYLYLREIHVHPYASMVGGLCFAFSGFVILGGTWYVFSAEAVYAALLLFALERIIRRGSWMLLPFPIAWICAYQPFNLFMYGLLILSYTFLRLNWNSEDPGRYLKTYSKIFGACLLGVGMSSVFLFGNLLQYWESPRVSGNSSYFENLLSFGIFTFAEQNYYITAVSRLFSSDLLGTGSHFRGWYNYLEAPIFYGGVLILLLVPQAFYFTRGGKRVLISVVCIAALVPVVFPFFRFAFWMFTGDYYRTYSLFVLLLAIVLGMYALSRIQNTGRLNVLLLIVTAAGLTAILYSPFLSKTIEPVGKIRFITCILLNLYALIVYALTRPGIRRMGLLLLLLTVCLELASFSYITVNHRPAVTTGEYYAKAGYNDYTMDVVRFLRSKDKSFFRVLKGYSSSPAVHGSLNDGKAQDYFGTTSYYSFNQKNYIAFLEGLQIIDGHDEARTRWAPGIPEGRPLLLSLVNVKYYLTKQHSPMLQNLGYVPIVRMGDVTAFENPYYLPLGIALDAFITTDQFHQLPPLQRDIAALNAFVIDPSQRILFNGYRELKVKDIPDTYDLDIYEKDIRKLRRDRLAVEAFGQNEIIGKINLKKNKLLFFSIPFDKGWRATVDGKLKTIQKIDFGFMGLPLEKGSHTIHLRYEPPFLISGAIFSGISFLIFFFLLGFDKGKTFSPLDWLRTSKTR